MKTFWLKFGSAAAGVYTGLTPTFTIFSSGGYTALPAPSVSELPAGSGFYKFAYGPTLPIIFQVDGGAAITTATDRYIQGVLDPIQSVDEKIGTLQDSFGSSAIDPTTVLGYLKRTQENLEGNGQFLKSTGVWSIFSRGSSTLLATKQLTNNITQATKT